MRLAREMIDAGELGEIRHFRGRYLQDWGDDPSLDTWRFDAGEAGSGALGDLGAHVVDLARYLVGDIATVSALVKTFLPGREVDDAIEAAVEFENGAIGTIESTRLALGRRNAFQWEINGSKGSLAFDMERLNELQVFRNGGRTRGFTTVLVSEADHPFWEYWWPPGHIIGWGDTFVNELHHLLRAIADDTEVAPHGATFEDGYRAAEVCDAIVRSGESGSREQLTYRDALASPVIAALGPRPSSRRSSTCTGGRPNWVLRATSRTGGCKSLVIIADRRSSADLADRAGACRSARVLAACLPTSSRPSLADVLKTGVRPTRAAGRPTRTIHPLVDVPHGASMPSGHAATAPSPRRSPSGLVHPRLRWPLLVLAALIAFSRVWLGVHYLSDVIVGAALGARSRSRSAARRSGSSLRLGLTLAAR